MNDAAYRIIMAAIGEAILGLRGADAAARWATDEVEKVLDPDGESRRQYEAKLKQGPYGVRPTGDDDNGVGDKT